MLDPLARLPLLPTAPPAPAAGRPAQGEGAAVEQSDVHKVAGDFTAVLMQMMVREMWKTVGENGEGPFGDSPGADVYRGLAETAFAESLAKRGSEPLVAAIENAIRRQAEAMDGAR